MKLPKVRKVLERHGQAHLTKSIAGTVDTPLSIRREPSRAPQFFLDQVEKGPVVGSLYDS